MYEDRLWPRN